MAVLLEALRAGTWVTRERIRIVAFALLAAFALGTAYLVATSDGLNDCMGRPLGTDFSNVYAAGSYVRDGDPAASYDPERQYHREREIFGANTDFLERWHYPPFFFAIAGPLAYLPYLPALLVWQGVTLAIYLWVMRGIVASGAPLKGDTESDRLGLLLALAFPAVFINLGHGHNGFLTAALFGGGLLLLAERPVIAGILFGALVYKPQFGILIPLALLAGGYWRAFVAATATVAILSLAVTLAFGPEIWTAFIDSMKVTREGALEHGDTGWHKIQSVFSWVRMWGGGLPVAYALQGAVSVAIAAALVCLWRSGAAFALKAAALLIGTILATPYSLDYDLMLLAPAIAFLAIDGLRRDYAPNFIPWEKTLLAALWLVPLVTRSVAQATLIPLAVPLMLAVFAFLLHRAINAGAPQASGVFRPAP